MKNVYLSYFKTAIKQDMKVFFSDSLIYGLSYFTFVFIIVMLYKASGRTEFFGNYTWPMMVWYLIFAELLLSNQSAFVRIISEEIQSGDLASRLTHPYTYPLALIFRDLGSVFVESLAILIFLIPLGIVLAGAAPLSLAGTIFGIVCIILAFMLDRFISISIGLIAFWTEDARPYSWIYNKMLFIFGGLLFPLEVFPHALQSIAKILPPAFLIYYPARLFVDFSWNLLFTVLIGQLSYLVLAGLIAFVFYKVAIKKVSINGG